MKMINKVTPLKEKILIEIPDTEESTSSGGIIIPAKKKKGALYSGIVRRVGKDVSICVPGEVVHFMKYKEQPFRLSPRGALFASLNETDVVGVEGEA